MLPGRGAVDLAWPDVYLSLRDATAAASDPVGSSSGSVRVQLPTSAVNVTLLAVCYGAPCCSQCCGTAAAAGKRPPLSPARRSPANPLSTAVTDRRTDGRTPYRYIDPAAYFAGSVDAYDNDVVVLTLNELNVISKYSLTSSISSLI